MRRTLSSDEARAIAPDVPNDVNFREVFRVLRVKTTCRLWLDYVALTRSDSGLQGMRADFWKQRLFLSVTRGES